MSTTKKPAFNKVPASSQVSEEEIIVFADAQVATLSATNVSGQQLPVAIPAPMDYNFADEKIKLPVSYGYIISGVHQQPSNETQCNEAISQVAENNTTTWIPAVQPPIAIPTPNFALIKQRRVAAQHAAGFYGAVVGLILLGPAGAVVCGFVSNKITKGIAKSAETRIRRDYLRKVEAAKAAVVAELPAHEAEVA